MLNQPSEYRRMAGAEGGLWWYRVLHEMVRRTLAAHPRGRAARVVDAGCGTGGLLAHLARSGFQNVFGFDLSPDAVKVCHERALPVQLGNLLEPGPFLPRGGLDAIVSNDTLYFFQPAVQERIISQFHEALAPGGILIMNLPALAVFRGSHDLAVGIGRRFSRADLPRLLPAAHFERAQARYWPFLLSPAVFAARTWQRLRMSWNPRPAPASDLRLPPAWLNGVLETMTRCEVSTLPWTPFASSLFVTARKPRGGPGGS